MVARGISNNMKIKKKRKPRTNPDNNLDFDGSHMFGWPFDTTTPAAKKLSARWWAKLCLGCGEKECRCKSKR